MLKTLLWVLFFHSLIQPLLANTKPILSLPHQEKKLKNGMTLYFIKYPSPGVVAYQLPVHVGSRHEIEKGKTGFAHFFEHLMFRGSKKRTGKQLNELYTLMGGENNAWTSNDLTNYHGIVSVKNLSKILEAEADRFQNLSFDEKALRDEAGAVLGEYNKNVAQPEFLLEEKLCATAFKVHPYGHTTMGYKEDVLQYGERYKDVWPFFKRYYRPSNTSLVLVGDIDFKAHTQLAEKLFGNWKDPQIEPLTIPQEPLQTEERFVEFTIDKPSQTRMAIAFKAPAFSTNNLDSITLQLIAELSFSTVSEFQKEYKFEKKWLDEIDGGHGNSVDPGLWAIALRFSDAGETHVDDIRKAVFKRLSSLKDNPPDEIALRNVKARFKNGALNTWFSDPNHLASQISVFTNYEPTLEVVNRYFNNLEKVTTTNITELAKRIINKETLTTVIMRGKNEK